MKRLLGMYIGKFILSDDDSTTRATLSRKKNNKHGCLPNDCCPPTFWADTNHGIKCIPSRGKINPLKSERTEAYERCTDNFYS